MHGARQRREPCLSPSAPAQHVHSFVSSRVNDTRHLHRTGPAHRPANPSAVAAIRVTAAPRSGQAAGAGQQAVRTPSSAPSAPIGVADAARPICRPVRKPTDSISALGRYRMRPPARYGATSYLKIIPCGFQHSTRSAKPLCSALACWRLTRGRDIRPWRRSGRP